MRIETRGDFVLHVHSKLDEEGWTATEVELVVVDGLMDGEVGRQMKRASEDLDCAGQATGRPEKVCLTMGPKRELAGKVPGSFGGSSCWGGAGRS